MRACFLKRNCRSLQRCPDTKVQTEAPPEIEPRAEITNTLVYLAL